MIISARIAFASSLLGILTAVTAEPASALVPQATASLQQQLRLQDELITEIRARAGGSVRRTTVTGPRGNTASRTVARGGAVVRPGVGAPRRLGTSGPLPLASRRRDRGWRRDWVRRGGHRGGVGGFAAGAWLLLVLQRSEPDAGFWDVCP